MTQRWPDELWIVRHRESAGNVAREAAYADGLAVIDVVLRRRSLVDTISIHHSRRGARVLVVAHRVIVLCLRYLIEELTEQEILAIDRAAEVANCGVTRYVLERDGASGGRLRLATYNVVAPLEQAGAPVTSRPDEPAGMK